MRELDAVLHLSSTLAGELSGARGLPRRRAHGGAAPEGMLDFSVSLNPLGPPDALALALSAHGAEACSRYPEPDSATLRAALAARHGVSPNEILVTNGACEAIELLMASLSPRRVVVLTPAFTEYEDAARAWGHDVVTVAAREEDGFHWPLDELERRLNLSQEDLVVLGNPGNPTGVLSEVPRLRAPLVVDETFLDFVATPAIAVSPMGTVSNVGSASFVGQQRAATDSRAWRIRSFTKLFACPGLRLGYVIGDVAPLRARQPAWAVSRLAQVAGLAMLADTRYQDFTRQFTTQCREELAAALRGVPGVRVFPGTANFLLLGVERAGEVARRLRERGIVVRLCDSFSGLAPDSFLRVAVRKRSENQRLVEALHAAR